MRTYKASGIASLSGVLTALLIGLLGAAAMGGMLYAMRHYVGLSLLVISPVLAAVATGVVLSKGVMIGKLRNSVVAGWVAVICTVAMFGSQHYLSYQLELKGTIRQQVVSGSAVADDAIIERLSDDYLKSKTGMGGFLGFLQLEAQEGFKVSMHQMGSTANLPAPVSGIWYWIVGGIESALALIAVVLFAIQATDEPFNEQQQQWYGKPQAILSAPTSSINDVLNALQLGQFEQAGAGLQRAAARAPYLELSVRQTPTKDPANIILIATVVQETINNQERKTVKRDQVLSGLITQIELERVLSNAVNNLEHLMFMKQLIGRENKPEPANGQATD